MIFPTTARSGTGRKFSSRNPSFQRMPSESSNVDAGGYTPTSEPVTRNPRSFNIPATGAIAARQFLADVCVQAFDLTFAPQRRFVSYVVHAGSKISSVALPASFAETRARTPNGRVSMGREVCPIAAPQTIGNPSGFSIR